MFNSFLISFFSAQSSSELTLSMGEGSVSCLTLHKTGLYAAGEDGVLRHLEVTTEKVRVKQAYPVGAPISSLSFNAPHNKLGLGSYKVSEFYCNFIHKKMSISFLVSCFIDKKWLSEY